MSFDQTDDDAMLRLRAGDDHAFGEIMDRWQTGIAHFLARLVGDADHALDLAQETFVRVYEHRFRYRPGTSFRAWIFTIATNLARNHNRWKQRHPTERFEHHGLPAVDPPDTRPQPDRETEGRDLSAVVSKAIAGLPEDFRVALILNEYEGMSHEQIGRIIGRSAKAVEMRLYRARAELRKRLTPFL